MLSTTHREAMTRLSPSQAVLVSDRLARRHQSFHPNTPSTEDLIRAVVDARFDQAEVVTAVVRETSPDGVAAIETLVGKPITRVTPKSLTRARAESLVNPRPTTTRARPADGRIITAVVPNPKKPGSASHVRFAKYQVGMTVSQALAAGVTTGDIKWDTERGFVTIE